MDLKSLKSRIEDFTAECKKRNEAFFAEAVKSIFEEFPCVDSFSWTQYTPYFNDGDTCNFSAHTDYFTMTTDGGEMEWEGEYELKEYANKAKNSPAINSAIEVQLATLEKDKKNAIEAEFFGEAERIKNKIEELKSQLIPPNTDYALYLKAYQTIKNVLGAFDDDAFKMLFGDHCRVLVAKDSVTTEEYSHD